MLAENWQVWQLADSAFPTGAFAYSHGLEAAVQAGDIRGSDSLQDFVTETLHQLASTALPLISAVLAGEPLEHVDQLWDSHLTNHTTNTASRALGRSLISTAVTTFGCESLRILKRRLRHDEIPGHQVVCWSATAKALHIRPVLAQQVYAFTTARDLLSAAVRLNTVGPGQAQHMLTLCGDIAEAACTHAASNDWRRPQQSFPLLDIIQGEHDRLYSRLFRN